MELVSEQDAAKLLGVSETTVRRWVNRKILTVYHTPTRRRRYKLDDIKRFQNTITPVEVK
jgi:excisionase family DNA binding protein